MISVLCFLWHDPFHPKKDFYTYDESYVHELRESVGKSLTVPHEFICVSDRPIPGVKTVPLDYTTHIPGTRFAKLQMFRPFGELAGKRLLYLDLDCVVTGSLDPLVDRAEDLVLWRNPNFGQPGRAFYNTSIILHTAGTRPEFWREFDRVRTWPMLRQKWGGTDQAWISQRASWKEAHWTAADGVYGAGRLKKPDGALDGVGTELPENARVVFFPGARTQRTAAKEHPWIARYRTDGGLIQVPPHQASASERISLPA